MKKKLLSEAQVRRFMGLAGIQPVNEMYQKDDVMSNEAVYEEDLMEEEDPMEEPEEMDDMKDEGGEADVEIDEDDLGDIKSALDTLQDKLAPLLDQAGGEMEEPAEDMPMDMGDEEGPAEEDEENLEDDLMEVDLELTEEEKKEQMEEIVNEVARRVAKRIVEAKRAHKKMNEALGRKK